MAALTESRLLQVDACFHHLPMDENLVQLRNEQRITEWII